MFSVCKHCVKVFYNEIAIIYNIGISKINIKRQRKDGLETKEEAVWSDNMETQGLSLLSS